MTDDVPARPPCRGCEELKRMAAEARARPAPVNPPPPLGEAIRQLFAALAAAINDARQPPPPTQEQP